MILPQHERSHGAKIIYFLPIMSGRDDALVRSLRQKLLCPASLVWQLPTLWASSQKDARRVGMPSAGQDR